VEKRVEGVITAVVTPFDSQGEVDKKGFRKIINYLIESGIHGLFPVGSQGEFFALNIKEKKQLIEIAVEEVNGRIFVMPNTGAITTKESIELSRFAEKAGADCVSIITPFFISPNQQELYDHYATICNSIEIPVLAYNNPDRTGGVRLEPSTIAKLANEFPNFSGIKDSSGDLTQIGEMIRVCPSEFSVIIGKDTVIYGGLMYGAAGAIAASSNVAPKLVVGIYEAYQAQDYEKAKNYQRKLAPLRMAFTLGSFPVVVKEALNMMNLPGGTCRLPIQPLSKIKRDELRSILEEMDLLD
jgi:4-hydroxy-tetrahydrodipicolinate synthase